MNLVLHVLGQRRLILAAVLMLSAIGLLAWLSMDRQEDPFFPYRYGHVLVPWPGADPEQVERLVLNPLEEELAQVEDIVELRGTARLGFAQVIIGLHQQVYDTERVWERVRVAVDRAQAKFPDGAGPVTIDDRTVDKESIVLAITGSDNLVEMLEAARRLRRELFRLPDIKRIELVGNPGEQLTIALDPAAAAAAGVDAEALIAQLAERNRTLAGGTLNQHGQNLVLMPRTEFMDLDELAGTPIRTDAGGVLPLGELADLRLEASDPLPERLWFDGTPAVGLGIVLPDNRINAVRMGERVRALLDEVRPAYAPLEIREMFYQPAWVEARLAELSRSLLIGVAIVALLLLATMGARMGVAVALLLPLVTLSALAVYAIGGGVLHQMAVAGLVIALGMLVDNAIVMTENYQWHLDRGRDHAKAASLSVRELAGPLAAATGTTLAAFTPLLLARGDTPDFTRAIPIVVMLTLVVSYLYAIFVSPLLASFVLRPKLPPSLAKGGRGGCRAPARKISLFGTRFARIPPSEELAPLASPLAPLLKKGGSELPSEEGGNPYLLNLRVGNLATIGQHLGHLALRRPLLILAAAGALILATAALSTLLSRDFFPSTDRNQFLVDLRFPEGTHLEHTDVHAAGLAADLRGLPGVQRVYQFTGSSGSRFYYNLIRYPGAPHFARLVVITDSDRDIPRLIRWLRTHAPERVPDAQIVANRLGQGPAVDAPVELRIFAEDRAALAETAERVLALVRETPGAVDARHELGAGVPALDLEIDDHRASFHGLNRTDIARAVTAASLGRTFSTWRAGREPVPMLIRSPEGERLPMAALQGLQLSNGDGQPVPVAELVRPVLRWQPAVIHHRDLQRMTQVLAEVAEGVTYADVLAELRPRLEALELPEGVRIAIGGSDAEAGEANSALFQTLPIGVLLLAVFLLFQFNSFRLVALVLVTVPLAAIGVVPGLLLAGQPFGFTAILGVIALAGIVVNNAIVLLDRMQAGRREGLDIDEAVTAAVARRIRPVLLTTATTVAGLLPLTFTSSTLWPPMAWAIISGLIASTLLTLLVVPALYRLVMR